MDKPVGMTVGMPGIIVFSSSVSCAHLLFLFFFLSLSCWPSPWLLVAPVPHACWPAEVKSKNRSAVYFMSLIAIDSDKSQLCQKNKHVLPIMVV